MPRSFLSELNDVNDSPLLTAGSSGHFPGQVYLVPFPGGMSCHPSIPHHANHYPSRSVLYHSSVCQVSMPSASGSSSPASVSTLALESSNSQTKALDKDRNIDATRTKAMQSTIKHLRSLLENEMKAREVDGEKIILDTEKIANLETALKGVQEELAATQVQLAATQEELAATREELVAEKKTSSEAWDLCYSQRKELQAAKKEKLELENSIQKSHERSESEMEIELELASTKEKLQVAMEKAESLQLENDAIKKNAETDLTKVTEDLSKTSKELKDYIKACDKLSKEIADCKQCITLLLASNNQLKLQEIDLKAQIQSLETIKSSVECSAAVEKTLRLQVEEFEGRENQLRKQCEDLKAELQAVKEAKESLGKWFKDLAKEHVYVCEYGEEKMYDEYIDKHKKFLEALQNFSPDGTRVPEMQEYVERIEEQLSVVEDCRRKSRALVQRALEKIEAGTATVPDINFRAPVPQLEITVERFDSVLTYLKTLV